MDKKMHQGGSLDRQFQRAITRESTRGERLDPAIQQWLERGLGVDLTNLRIHTDQIADRLTCAVNAVAFASGTHIFFRSGFYQPKSIPGMFLLAHEAAHLLQQAKAQSLNPAHKQILIVGRSNSIYEFEADLAAIRILMDIPAEEEALPANLTLDRNKPVTIVQCHGSWEHRMLGDSKPRHLDTIAKRQANWKNLLEDELKLLDLWRQDPYINKEQITRIAPHIHPIHLRQGLWATYGEINTLPDYLPNPRYIDEQPQEIILPILQFVRQESYNKIELLLKSQTILDHLKKRNILHPLTVDYPFKNAISPYFTGWSWLDTVLATKAIDDFTYNLGPKKSNHYGAVLARNACHFAPFSWYRWETFYTVARHQARQAFDSTDSAVKQKLTYQTWMNHGYADHFLQDSFAAGHLINKTLVMQWFLEFATSDTMVGLLRGWVNEGLLTSLIDKAVSWAEWLAEKVGLWGNESWAKWFMADWEKIKSMDVGHHPVLHAPHLYFSASDPMENDPNTMMDPAFFESDIRDPQTAEEQVYYEDRMLVAGIRQDRVERGKNLEVIYQDYLTFLDNSIVQAASAGLHDYYNEHSLWVSSRANPTPFQIWGDDTLLNGGDGVRIASETAEMSRQSIEEIINTGQTSISLQQIRDRFPTRAGSDKHSIGPLDQWNARQKEFCLKQIFPEVNYYLLQKQRRITYVSKDFGGPEKTPGQLPWLGEGPANFAGVGLKTRLLLRRKMMSDHEVREMIFNVNDLNHIYGGQDQLVYKLPVSEPFQFLAGAYSWKANHDFYKWIWKSEDITWAYNYHENNQQYLMVSTPFKSSSEWLDSSLHFYILAL